MKKLLKKVLCVMCCLSFVAAAGCNTGGGGDNKKEESKGPYPVIIIPGITGSELKGTETLYWPPDTAGLEGGNYLTFIANFMALALNENAESAVTMNPVRFSPMTEYIEGSNIGAANTYGDLTIALSDELGKENVWFFGYDWRMDNRVTAVELSNYIDKVLEETKADKVNIVAHSMGGLVTSAYLAKYGDEGKKKLDRVITCGTPFLGSQGAHSTVSDGSGFMGGEYNDLAGVFKQIAITLPSIYQLLPPESWDSLGLAPNGTLKADATTSEKQAYEFYKEVTCNMESIWKDVKHINVVGKTHDTAGVNGSEDGDGTVTRYSATVDGKFTSGSHTLVEMELNHNELVTNADAIKDVVNMLNEESYCK